MAPLTRHRSSEPRENQPELPAAARAVQSGHSCPKKQVLALGRAETGRHGYAETHARHCRRQTQEGSTLSPVQVLSPPSEESEFGSLGSQQLEHQSATRSLPSDWASKPHLTFSLPYPLVGPPPKYIGLVPSSLGELTSITDASATYDALSSWPLTPPLTTTSVAPSSLNHPTSTSPPSSNADNASSGLRIGVIVFLAAGGATVGAVFWWAYVRDYFGCLRRRRRDSSNKQKPKNQDAEFHPRQQLKEEDEANGKGSTLELATYYNELAYSHSEIGSVVEHEGSIASFGSTPTPTPESIKDVEVVYEKYP